MLEMFVFGTFWFWAFCLIEFIGLMVFVNKEHGFPAFITLLFGIFWFNWVSQIPILRYVIDNPKIIMIGIATYIVIGVVWSIIKYTLHIRKLKREYENKLKTQSYKPDKPDFKSTASEITIWMAYWPFSMLWSVMSDLVINIFETIQDALKGLYKSIYENAFGKED